MKTIELVVGVCFLSLASPCAPILPETSCEEATTTPEMIRCERQRFRVCRATLEHLGAQLRRQLPPHQAERFAVSAHAWETYSYLACASESSLYEGGSMEPLVYQACRADLECSRLTWLRRAFRETLREAPSSTGDERGDQAK